MKKVFQKLKKIRINIFDVFVLALIALILIFFLMQKYTRKSETVDIRLQVSNDDWWYPGAQPPNWYSDNLKVGQVSFNSFGAKSAEIKNIENFDVGANRRKTYVDLRIQVNFDSKRQIFLYNFQPLQIGKPLDLTFEKNNVRGIVTMIDSDQVPQEVREIEVQIKKVPPWIADDYKVGETVAETNGRELAKILDVQVNKAEYSQFSDIRGAVILAQDPFFKDVTLRLRIMTEKSAGVSYFIDGAAIKVGERIWFQFPTNVIRDAEISKIIH